MANTITPKKVIETICQDVCNAVPEFTGFKFHYKRAAGMMNFRYVVGSTVISIGYANRLYYCEFTTNLHWSELNKLDDAFKDKLSNIVAASIIRNFEDEYVRSTTLLIRSYILFAANRDSAFSIVRNNIRAGYANTIERVIKKLYEIDPDVCGEFLDGLFEFCVNDGEITAQILEMTNRLGFMNANKGMEL